MTENDRRGLLSTLWIFAVLNYLYCDVLGHMDAGVLRQLLAGDVGGVRITPGFLFAAGVLMQVPIWMVLLSRVLPWRFNRWANVAAAVVMTGAQVGSLFAGGVASYYRLYSVVEIACTVFIGWRACSWRPVGAARLQPVG